MRKELSSRTIRSVGACGDSFRCKRLRWNVVWKEDAARCCCWCAALLPALLLALALAAAVGDVIAIMCLTHMWFIQVPGTANMYFRAEGARFR